MTKFLAKYSKHTKAAIIFTGNKFVTYRIVGAIHNGLGFFEIIDRDCARLTKTADDLAIAFWQSLPSQPFILAHQTDMGWSGVPQDATTIPCSEILLSGIPEESQTFDLVTVKFDGVHLWYEQHLPQTSKYITLRNIYNRHLGRDLSIRKAQQLNASHEEISALQAAMRGHSLWRSYNLSRHNPDMQNSPGVAAAARLMRLQKQPLPLGNFKIHEITKGFFDLSIRHHSD